MAVPLGRPHSAYPGSTDKAVYFEVVCGTLFFAPLVLVRDIEAVWRTAVAFVAIGLVVAHAATPGSIPS